MKLQTVRTAAFVGAQITVVACLFVCVLPIPAQSQSQKPALITQPIDEQKLVTLAGSTRPEMQAAKDLGPVADDLLLAHMYLQLKRAPGQDEAVKTLIDQMHDPKASQYHQWLTADQVAARFGPAEQDVQTISGWLQSHGFTVNVVYPQNGVIDFSGPASSMREAFHTEIHQFNVNGQTHIANISNPQIPAALAPAMLGIISMSDFHPKPAALRPRTQYTLPGQGFTDYGLAPADLQTIYNFNPLYAAGITGEGQTIVIVEDSDVYSLQDWTTFRDTFGLNKQFPHGSFQQIHPQPTNAQDNGGPCADPGVNPNGDDLEAAIDAQWASASAPNAAVVAAACANTNTTFGGYIALQNLLTAQGRPPGIVSISYAEAETLEQVPPPTESYVSQLYQLAVLQGVSIFVAAGDNGGAAVDYFAPAAMNGITVNGLASTTEDVAVGGTDFGDYYLGETSQYWSATNGKYFNSALSYIPEIPWNESCASRLIANYLGYSTTYGSEGFCNTPLGSLFLETWAGSGGPSDCASGTPSIYGIDESVSGEFYAVASGTCKGFSKPAYQTLVIGNPNDGARDLPDVSLFAGDFTWFHYYLICLSNPVYQGACNGDPSTWLGDGGTSFATPIMAGIQAMINQSTGNNYQGNPNYILYALAALEYDFGGTAACDATLGNKISQYCIFHDVTLGDNDVPCQPLVVNDVTIGTFDCYIPSGTIGVLSRSNTSYEPAFPTTPGWDFATGLGSVNAYNLVRAWPGAHVP